MQLFSPYQSSFSGIFLKVLLYCLQNITQNHIIFFFLRSNLIKKGIRWLSPKYNLLRYYNFARNTSIIFFNRHNTVLFVSIKMIKYLRFVKIMSLSWNCLGFSCHAKCTLLINNNNNFGMFRVVGSFCAYMNYQ